MNSKTKSIMQFIRIQVFQIPLILAWILLTPSKEPYFLGLSKDRLVIAGIVLLLFLVELVISLWLWKKPDRISHITHHIEHFLIDKKLLIPFIFIQFFTALIIGIVTTLIVLAPMDQVFLQTWGIKTFPNLYLIFHGILPLIVWIVILLVENIVFLTIVFHPYFIDPSYWSIKSIVSATIGTFLVLFTFLHWFILFFQIPIFTNFPAWYWAIEKKPFSPRDGLYLLITFFLLGVSLLLVLKKKKIKLALLLIFITSIWLQIGINYLEHEDFQMLGNRYFISLHSTYPRLASENNLSIFDNIRNYDEIFSVSTFTKTKPPGLMVFYITLERLINGNPLSHALPSDLRFERLRTAIAIGFPICSALMVFLLFAFSRRMIQLEPTDSIMVVIAYVLCTNVILLSLFADQALYPLLFLMGVWLIIEIINRQSSILLFLLGIILFVFTFFAFPMLPLFAFSMVYLFLRWFKEPQIKGIWRQIKLGIMFLLGVISSYWLFRWVFHYDFFKRFSETMAINHNFDFYTRVGLQPVSGNETFVIRIKQIINALFLNNLEFATVVGIGFFILFILYGIRLIIRVIKHKADGPDTILTSLFLSFIAVNAAGSAQGEVGRLWMFWNPMVLICSILEFRRLKINKLAQFCIIILTQIITLVLTYHFQDLLLSN
jgi:hypothetical protein